jgi:enoyl-CoA hydratase/carnithine racemase
MSAEPSHLLVDEVDGILIVTLNRPEKLNSITGAMLKMFEQALHRFRDTPALKVMLIRATGRYFCAGMNMHEAGGEPPEQKSASEIRETHRRGNSGFQCVLDEMEHIEKPIVAAHHATCVGGGLEISLSCDFRLAAKNAAYAFPEGLFGVLPASNGVSRLTRICGTHWARWLIMANMKASADLALTMGLVHQVFPDETFEEEVMAFCRHLTKQNSEQMGAAKIAIELARDVNRDQGRHIERMANSALMLNPSYQEGLKAYIQNIGRGVPKS